MEDQSQPIIQPESNAHAPISAFILSWIMPGLGHFFLKYYRDGFLYFGLYLISFLFIIFCLLLTLPIAVILVLSVSGEIFFRLLPAIQGYRKAKLTTEVFSFRAAIKSILIALASFFVPGLGHFIFYKRVAAIVYFTIFVIVKLASLRHEELDILLFIIKLNSCVDAYLLFYGYQKRTRILTRVFLFYICGYGLLLGSVFLTTIVAMKSYHLPTEGMEPTVWADGRILVNKLYYKFNEPKQGDIITFWHIDREKRPQPWVQRILAVGGQTVRFNGKDILVDGKSVDFLPDNTCEILNFDYASNSDFLVPADSYFMIGDNICNSFDSRFTGPVSRDKIIGKATYIYWPFSERKILR